MNYFRRNLPHGLALLCLALLLGLSFVPWGRAPSLAGWAQAYMRGGGKPHFPITGTVEGRVEDFLKRHPELRPQWRDVAAEDNGFVLLKQFVESEKASRLALTDELSQMLIKDNEWDQDAVRDYYEEHREEQRELRKIALLPERSARGKSGEDYLDAPLYKKMSDVLLLSFKQHLHAKRWTDAFTDFSALYGFAAHLDRHEVSNLLDKTVGIMIRLAPHEALREFLKNAPADMDWSPWIEVLVNEPPYAQQMEAVWRGEAWYGMHLITGLLLFENPMWDITEFEDAYSVRMLMFAKSFANAQKLTAPDHLQKIEDELESQEASLSKGAVELLHTFGLGAASWCQGSLRTESQFALTLAALQLLQSERTGGRIQSAADPRLGQLAIDPSNGKPFVFDPATRQLSAAADSALHDVAGYEDPVQLPRR